MPVQSVVRTNTSRKQDCQLTEDEWEQKIVLCDSRFRELLPELNKWIDKELPLSIPHTDNKIPAPDH